MVLALARHIFEHGTFGRFYSQVRRYHHEGRKVYWSMAASPEAATLINRCGVAQTVRGTAGGRYASENSGSVTAWPWERPRQRTGGGRVILGDSVSAI